MELSQLIVAQRCPANQMAFDQTGFDRQVLRSEARRELWYKNCAALRKHLSELITHLKGAAKMAIPASAR